MSNHGSVVTSIIFQWTMEELIGEYVGRYELAIDLESTVFPFSSSAEPRLAFVRSANVYLRPESGYDVGAGLNQASSSPRLSEARYF